MAEGKHLEAADGAFHALVAVLAAGALLGLLHILGGQHAEDGGLAVFQAYFHNAVGDSLRDELEMAGLALDDAADADDRVHVVTVRHHHIGAGGEFIAARHIFHKDVLRGDALLDQGFAGSF